MCFCEEKKHSDFETEERKKKRYSSRLTCHVSAVSSWIPSPSFPGSTETIGSITPSIRAAPMRPS